MTENSPAAFQNAVDLGCPVVETDVRATGDGHAIVFHDATMDRTTNLTGPIAALTREQVGNSRLANNEAPMTLVEALVRWPDLTLNVDVKSDDGVEPFLRAVAQTGAWDRVCAAAFSTARLRRLRRLGGPRLATSAGPSEVARIKLGLADHSPACALQVPERVRGVPVVTPGFVRRAHRAGLQVHVWVVDEPDRMARLLDLGVDALITDQPTRLREVLARPRPDG